MTLKDLQNLPRLQIPDINLGIFASAHNKFPSRNAKAGEQAVRIVGMAYVGFDTS